MLPGISSWDVTMISGTTRGSPTLSLEKKELSLLLNFLQPDYLWMTTILKDLFSIVSWWGRCFHMTVVFALLPDIDNINYQELQSGNITILDPQLSDWTNFTKFGLKVFFAV